MGPPLASLCARSIRRQNNCSYSTRSTDATTQHTTAAVPNPEPLSRALDGLRSSGRAVAVEALVELDGFAPPSVISQAARLQARQRAFNVAVTNIPGPQGARRLLGRELRSIYPALPLARNQALSVAVVSYAGRLCFGLLADREALDDLDLLAGALEQSLAELAKGSRAKRSREQR